MGHTYIYSKSCQCSCFSLRQGSQGHTPEHPSHPRGRKTEFNSSKAKLCLVDSSKTITVKKAKRYFDTISRKDIGFHVQMQLENCCKVRHSE